MSSTATSNSIRRSSRNKKRKQETKKDIAVEKTKVPSSWSKQILASVKKDKINKRQLEYSSSSSSSSEVVKKKDFWDNHVRHSHTKTKRKKKESYVVTPSPAPSQYHSPTVSTIDLLSSTSRSSHTSGTSSSYPLPDDVIDIDAPNECKCNLNELNESYLNTYGKEYHNYLFSKEETSHYKPRTRHRAKLEFQFVDNSPCDYMHMQPFISKQMRAILVDWLIEVQEDLGLMDGTLFLAVRLLDRALSCKGDGEIHIEKENLQCLGW